MGPCAAHHWRGQFPGAVQIAKLRIQLEHEPPDDGLVVARSELKPQKFHTGVGPENFIRDFSLQAVILSRGRKQAVVTSVIG